MNRRVAALLTPALLVALGALGAGTAVAALPGAWNPNFDRPGPSSGYDVFLVMGDDLYLAGEFDHMEGLAGGGLVRWDLSQGGWSSVGGGMDDPGGAPRVRALAEAPNGHLVAGGRFARAGGNTVHNVAEWDGSAWNEFGSGLGIEVTSVAYGGDGQLYVGGEDPTQSANRLLVWAGVGWWIPGGGVQGSVYAMTAAGDELYIAGSFAWATGTANNITRYNTATHVWSPLVAGGQNGVNGTVRALIQTPDGVVVGGDFTTAGGVTVNGVALWDGSGWTPMGGAAPADYRYLAAMGSDLVACRIEGGVPALVRWTGSAWEPAVGVEPEGAGPVALHGSDLLAGFTSVDMGGGLRAYGGGRWDGAAWHGFHTDRVHGVSAWVAAAAAGGGQLYVAGVFDRAGLRPATYVARWDGTTWNAMGAPPDDEPTRLEVWNGDLYAGGAFTHIGAVTAGDGRGIARWDGAAWNPLGAGLQATVGDVLVKAMSGDAGGLFVGGGFDQAGSVPVRNLARWDGAAWHDVGGGVNGRVDALAADGANLYVAGQFTEVGAGIPADGMARWNGSAWLPMPGIGPTYVIVRDALVWNGDLVIAGVFDEAGSTPVHNIARWDGSAWVNMDLPYPDALDDQIFTLEDWNGYLVAGGNLASVPGLPAWDGTAWTTLGAPSPIPDFYVYALAADGPNLAVGGVFSRLDGTFAQNLALWETAATAVGGPAPPAPARLLAARPNPFRGATRIDYRVERPGPVTLEIFDASGRRVRALFEGRREAGAFRAEWDGRDAAGREAPGGVYFYRLRSADGSAARRVVLLR